MASKGIPVVKARFAGFGGISLQEQERRHQLTLALENLEDNRDSISRQETLQRALSLRADLVAGPRWDDYRSDTGAFLRNLWYDRPEKYYYKYVDLTARLRELIHWAQGGTYDPTTARIHRPYSEAIETTREAPVPVAERIKQIAREDVIPAVKKLGAKLEKDALFRKRFLTVLGALVLFILIKKLL